MKVNNIILSLFIVSLLCGQDSQYPSGIIYGPKAAFRIDAPDDWVLDNKAGLSDGLNCVLYLKNSTWKDSPVIMYAKVAGSKFEDVEEFIKFAINEFCKEDSNFVYKRLTPQKINEQFAAIIYDYFGGPYKNYERVAYIQVPKAVCYIVFSSKNKNDFNKYSDVLFRIVNTFTYEPDYISDSQKSREFIKFLNDVQNVQWKETPSTIIKNNSIGKEIFWLGRLDTLIIINHPEAVEFQYVCDHLFFQLNDSSVLKQSAIRAINKSDGKFLVSLITKMDSISLNMFKSEFTLRKSFLLVLGDVNSFVKIRQDTVVFLFTKKMSLGVPVKFD